MGESAHTLFVLVAQSHGMYNRDALGLCFIEVAPLQRHNKRLWDGVAAAGAADDHRVPLINKSNSVDCGNDSQRKPPSSDQNSVCPP
jgi:hypothetical protein